MSVRMYDLQRSGARNGGSAGGKPQRRPTGTSPGGLNAQMTHPKKNATTKEGSAAMNLRNNESSKEALSGTLPGDYTGLANVNLRTLRLRSCHPACIDSN